MIFANKQIQELTVRYEAALEFGYNQAANTQVQIIKELCNIASKEAFMAISQIIANCKSHEYMTFAIPEILGEQLHLSRMNLMILVLEVLLQGIQQGQNVTIRNECIRIVNAQSADCYKALLDYRDSLMLDKANRPSDWSSLLRNIDEAVRKLAPYVEETLQVT